MPKWISTTQATKLFQCSYIHIHRLAQAGRLRSRRYKIGKREVLQVSEADVNKLLPEMLSNNRVGRQLYARDRERNVILNRGYRQVYKPEHPGATCQGYIPEHRLVMEEKLGRFLKRGEEVHHINSNKTDNRPENLVLYKNRSDHLKHGHGEVSAIIMKIRRKLHIDPNFKSALLKFLRTNT